MTKQKKDARFNLLIDTCVWLDVVGANHLVGKQYPKRRADRAQHAVTEVRFHAWRNGVDVRGPEDVNVRETRRE